MKQEDLLDEFISQKGKNIYTKLSFFFFFISVLLFMFLMSKVPSHIIAGQVVPVIAKSLVLADYVSCLAGVGASIMSIVKREKPTALKIISSTLNLMTFVFLIGLLCFWLLR